jgi:hypothetical protein
MPTRTAVISQVDYTYFYTNTFVTLRAPCDGLEFGRVYLATESFAPIGLHEAATCSLVTYPDREPVDGLFPTDDFCIVRHCELNAARTHLEMLHD